MNDDDELNFYKLTNILSLFTTAIYLRLDYQTIKQRQIDVTYYSFGVALFSFHQLYANLLTAGGTPTYQFT